MAATADVPAAAAVPGCLWCGAPATEVSGERRRRCPRCRAETTWPAPSAAELESAYTGWYRPAGGRFSGPGDRLLRRTRAPLAARLDEIAPPGAVLDVGSGDGALLAALRERGRRAVGVERAGADEGEQPAEGPWAAVVFWHSLEHLPDPGERVASLSATLQPDGVVVISMPNLDSLQARAFGDRWLHLDLPRHLVHVPAPALIERLRAGGLRVERVSHLRGGQVVFGWLHGLVGMLPGRPDLYDAIRRPEARSAPLGGGSRLAALAAAALLLPVAATLAAVEAALRRGGTVYVEARRV
jgi:SAM-dependent methyltransferase